MADFITPWMAEHSGPRLVDLDIQKGQQAMAQIDLQKAQAENQRAQTELKKDQLQTQILTRKALEEMSKMHASGISMDSGFDMTGQPGGGGDMGTAQQQWVTGGNHLWKMSQILAPVNPKLSGTLANQASQIDRRQVLAGKDILRAQQIAAQTQSERFDLAGRKMNSVQTPEDLIDAARYYEQATGMSTGLFGPNGEPPEFKHSTRESADRHAQLLARQFADSTMKAKDRIAAQSREARDAVYAKGVADTAAHREWQRNVDKQREISEAKRAGAGAKAGEKPLTTGERTEGTDFIKSVHPNIDPPERAKQLGAELMDTAKRMMADPNRNPNLTMSEAKREAYKKLVAEGRLAGVPGSGRSPQSPLNIPKDDKGNINQKGFEANRWYQTSRGPMFWDGSKWQTQQQLIQNRGTAIPQSDEGGDDEEDAELAALSGMNDDDEEEDD